MNHNVKNSTLPNLFSKLANGNTKLGVLLIFGGVYLLFQNLGVVAGGFTNLLVALFWTFAFGTGAVLSLLCFFSNPARNWWAAIPSAAFSGLAAVSLIDRLVPVAEPITGPLFLGSLGIGFAAVFFFNRVQWWAVIPAGIMTSLAVTAGIDEVPLMRSVAQEAFGIDSGTIFLLGLSLTFLAVATLQVQGQRMTWALIPAGVLMAVVLLGESNFGQLANHSWPIILIIGGGVLMLRKLSADSRLNLN